jgi:hypothetical protein
MRADDEKKIQDRHGDAKKAQGARGDCSADAGSRHFAECLRRQALHRLCSNEISFIRHPNHFYQGITSDPTARLS